jgi:hypothetical protein
LNSNNVPEERPLSTAEHGQTVTMSSLVRKGDHDGEAVLASTQVTPQGAEIVVDAVGQVDATHGSLRDHHITCILDSHGERIA